MEMTILEVRARLADVRREQAGVEYHGDWSALEELADYYEGIIEELSEKETE